MNFIEVTINTTNEKVCLNVMSIESFESLGEENEKDTTHIVCSSREYCIVKESYEEIKNMIKDSGGVIIFK